MMIKTERLMLRMPSNDDWPAYRDYRLSPRSTAPGEDIGMVWTLFAALFGHWTLRGFGRFIATLNGRAIGHFGPYRPEGHPEGELTWTLWDAGLEGKGYAFEATQATRDHVFGPLGWTTSISYIDPVNRRSQALASRLGAVRDPLAACPYDGFQVWRHGKGIVA